ncbi:unnamed protein product [Pieris macdunnoughi]|uniref:Uncharacterized protein n=1 Tax=Pieris macdunnoughi TaxID=345717 RepID=A0A821QAY6_9NEOP|nr:unnamed protein product [Pieris macdunnoughi]
MHLPQQPINTHVVIEGVIRRIYFPCPDRANKEHVNENHQTPFAHCRWMSDAIILALFICAASLVTAEIVWHYFANWPTVAVGRGRGIRYGLEPPSHHFATFSSHQNIVEVQPHLSGDGGVREVRKRNIYMYTCYLSKTIL